MRGGARRRRRANWLDCVVSAEGTTRLVDHQAPNAGAAEAPEGAPAEIPVNDALRRLMERELRRPVASARAAPPPAGIAPEQVRPITGDALAHAKTPADIAIAELALLLVILERALPALSILLAMHVLPSCVA